MDYPWMRAISIRELDILLMATWTHQNLKEMNLKLRTLLVATCGSLALLAAAQTPTFIDTQSQFDPSDSDHHLSLKIMLQEMDRVGIRKTLIVPPPFPFQSRFVYDAERIKEVIGKRTDRFAFLAGGGSLNLMVLHTPAEKVTPAIKTEFRKQAEAILAAGAVGFGELTAEHLSLPLMKQDGLNHFHNVVAPDHPLLLLLADIAAEKDVPIDFHFDIFPRTIPTPTYLKEGNPPELRENQQAFERLLQHNPKARFTWAHLGSDPGQQRTPRLMQELLDRHPNLYAAFRIVNQGPAPMTPINAQGILKPEWLALIQRYPDRFTMHTDMFYVSSWPPRRGSRDSHEKVVNMLSQLPPELARKLAYENAQMFYKLKD
jgi:hypothetical protein